MCRSADCIISAYFCYTIMYCISWRAFLSETLYVFPYVRKIASFETSCVSRSLDNVTRVNLIFKYQARRYREPYYRFGVSFYLASDLISIRDSGLSARQTKFYLCGHTLIVLLSIPYVSFSLPTWRRVPCRHVNTEARGKILTNVY